MRYAKIEEFDVNNGKGIGCSLFVQGCPIHCKGCFNSETWDFDGGKEWDDNVMAKFIKIANKDYIDRITILGGEPLCKDNINDVERIIDCIRNQLPNKKLWLYTGYDEFDSDQKRVLFKVDYAVIGPYKEELRDLTLAFRGSSNQAIIDIKKSYLVENGNMILTIVKDK